ncbi:MAG: hypothetical protein ABIC19_01130 [Patescibacteria group bacterium]|nr:hypothetical protein [Patescibacteria group bacterium]
MKPQKAIIPFIFPILVLTVIFLAGCFDYPDTLPNTKEQWPGYKNSRYEFELQYPPRWELGEAPANNDGREIISPDKTIYCHAYGFNNSLTNKQGQPQSLDEFIQWLTEQPGLKVIQQENTQLAGYEAREIIFAQEGKVTQAVYILGQISGRGLSCAYDDLKQWEMYRQSFEKMKTSFKVSASLDK